MERPKTGFHPRRNAPAAERVVGRHQVDRDGRAEIDDQHVAPRVKHRGAHGGGQPVAAQRLGRMVSVGNRHGGLRGEFQQVIRIGPDRFDHVVRFAARRSDDGLRGPAALQQLAEHRRMQPLHAALGDDPSAVKNGQLDKGVAYVYDQIQSCCSVLYASSTSLTFLTVIANRLLCCLSTNRSGRCVTRCNRVIKASLL